MAFLLVDIALNMAQIFSFIFVYLCYFDSVDLNSYMAFLAVFMTFVFLRGLGLKLICINKRAVVGLSLIFVPILIFLYGIIFVFLS